MSGTFYAPVASSLSHTHTFPPKSKTHGQFGPPPSEPAGEAKEKDNIFEEEGKEQAAAGPGAEVEASTDAEGKSVGRALGGAVLPPIPGTPSKGPTQTPPLTGSVQKKTRKTRKKGKGSAHLAKLAAIRETDKFVAAASAGRLEEVVYRIRKGQEVDAPESFRQFTALQGAASFGHDKCVRVILEYGASVDLHHTKSKQTPLLMASHFGRASIVQILLDAGANKSLRDVDGNNALALCEEYHHENVRAKLRDPPLMMETPSAGDFSTKHVSFSWKEPISRGANIMEYRIVWKICPGGFMDATEPNKRDLMWDEEGFGYGDPIDEVSPERRTHTFENLAPACTIVLAMRARNLAGYGPLSHQLTMHTSPDVPGIPADLVFITKNATSASYTFSFPLDYGEPIDYYQFFYRVYPPDPDDEVACQIFAAAVADGRVAPMAWVPYPHKILVSPCQIVNLEPGTTYDFKLRAHNAVGYGEFGKISGKIRTDDAPYLVRKTKFSITLAWTAQVGALHYEMQYQENQMDHTWATVSSAIKGTECLCDNLYPAREYRYRIRSYTSNGWSSYEGSALSQWIRTNDDITEPPGIPTMASVGIWDIGIEWPAPVICNGQPVDYYEVQLMQMSLDKADTRILEEIQVWKTVNAQNVAQKYDSTGLEPGISYRYRVRAHNLVGWSLWGEPSENFTTRPKEPNQMMPPTGHALNPYSIHLDFVRPVENGRKVTHYCIEQWQMTVDPNDPVNTTEKVGGWKILRDNIVPTTFTVENLKPGLMYKFRVKARNEVGWSQWSDEGPPIETFPIAPFVPPVIPTPSGDSTSEAIFIHWKAPLTNGAPIDAYEVEQIQLSIDPNDHDRKLEDITGWKSVATIYRIGNLFSGPLDTPALNYAAKKLEPGTEYKYRVRCRNWVGWSPLTDSSSTLITQPIEPDQPRFPVKVDAFNTPHSVGVSWEAPKTNGAPIIEYQLDMKQLSVDLSYTAAGGLDGPEDGPETRVVYDWTAMMCADAMKHCVENLDPGIKFSFRVRCRNLVGWSLWSETSSVLRTDPTPPDPVENVKFDMIEKREVSFNWELPICRGVIVDKYEVQHQSKIWVEGGEDEGLKLAPTEWKTLCIVSAPLRAAGMTGLLPFTEHRYRVRAHGHDWGEFSVPSPWARTLAAHPSRPGAPELVQRTDSLLSVKWGHKFGQFDSSISNGSTITTYELQCRIGRSDVWVPVKEDMVMEHEEWGCQSVVPYWFRVRALNGEGWSEYSEESEEMRPKRRV